MFLCLALINGVRMVTLLPIIEDHFYRGHRIGEIMLFEEKPLNREIVRCPDLMRRGSCRKKYKWNALSSQMFLIIYLFSKVESIHFWHH